MTLANILEMASKVNNPFERAEYLIKHASDYIVILIRIGRYGSLNLDAIEELSPYSRSATRSLVFSLENTGLSKKRWSRYYMTSQGRDIFSTIECFIIYTVEYRLQHRLSRFQRFLFHWSDWYSKKIFHRYYTEIFK
jgi:hypothetical protein